MIILQNPTPRDIRALRRRGHDISQVAARSRIVKRNGEMVGYVAYVPSTMAPEVLHIFHEFRRQGIGRVVVNMLTRCTQATMMTIWAVPSAVAFWQKMGFATKGQYYATERGCVEMRRSFQ